MNFKDRQDRPLLLKVKVKQQYLFQRFTSPAQQIFPGAEKEGEKERWSMEKGRLISQTNVFLDTSLSSWRILLVTFPILTFGSFNLDASSSVTHERERGWNLTFLLPLNYSQTSYSGRNAASNKLVVGPLSFRSIFLPQPRSKVTDASGVRETFSFGISLREISSA